MLRALANSVIHPSGSICGSRVFTLHRPSPRNPMYLITWITILIYRPRKDGWLRYSKLLVENCNIFIPHLCLAAPLEFRQDLDTHKTRMNWLSCVEESMTICSTVLIQYQRVTDRQTDRRTVGRTDRRLAYS